MNGLDIESFIGGKVSGKYKSTKCQNFDRFNYLKVVSSYLLFLEQPYILFLLKAFFDKRPNLIHAPLLLLFGGKVGMKQLDSVTRLGNSTR